MSTYFGSSVADATLATACDMSTMAGGTETSVTTSVSGSNHFAEIWSQGGSQSSQTSIGTPSGKGWISSATGAGTFATGNWSASCTFSFGGWDNSNTVTIRFYRLSGGVYTSIGTIVASITGTTKTTYTFAATSMSTIAFGASDQLYVDLWLTDNSGAGGDSPTVYVSNSASMGVTGDLQITTSTFTPGTGATKKDIAFLGKIAATGTKDVAFLGKIALGAQKDIAFLGKISAPPAQVGIAIANSAVIINEDSWQLHLKADERQRCQFTVEDYPGSATYTRGQRVTVDDPTLGRLFSGVILDDKLDKSNVYPDATLEHQIDTVGNEYFIDKRTSQRLYTNPTYAGNIVIDAVVDTLGAEGIVANYARRIDTTQADWALGTLTNTIGTSNVGDGDLELVSTGGVVTSSYLVQTDWSTGTFSNTQANAGGDLSIIGSTRNWDNGDKSNQTLFGNGSPSDGITNKQYFLTCSANSATVSRLDFAGTWTNGTIEVDMVLASDVSRRSLTIRQTTWNNVDDYAYAMELRNSTIEFRRGHNGSGGTTSQLASHNFSPSLGAGTYRVRIVMNGSNFTVSLNGTQYLSVSDSTYSAAGYIALRNRDTLTSSLTNNFDNFGVMSAFSGTWTSASTSINSVTTIASSVITWDTSLSQGGTILVQSSIDGGSTYQTCSNGAVIPGLTAGVSGTGKSVLIKITLTTTAAATMPDIRSLSWTVAGGYVASGTRVSPLLSLAPAGRIGSTVVAWNANLPSTATTLGVDTSVDGGVTWNDVTGNNGGPIPGLNGQPDPVIDGFDTNTLANYISTNGLGGSAASWAPDTTHSRITATNGASAILASSGINIANIDLFADMDISDAGGLAFCYSGPTSYYGVVVADNQAVVGTKNTLTLYKSVPYSYTVLADGPLAYYRLGEALGATTAADSSGNGRDGNYLGSFTLGTTGPLKGDAGTATLLDGSTGNISTPSIPANPNFSLEAWGYTTSSAPQAIMAQCSGGIDDATFYWTINGVTSGFTTANSVWKELVSPTLSLYTWHHLALTYNGASLLYYVDGVVAASASVSGIPETTPYPALIGVEGNFLSRWWQGALEEVCIYGKCLTGAQVLNHYNAGMSGTLQQAATSSISFTRGLKYRLRATNTDGTIVVSLDGKQALTYTDPTPLPAGSAGLYQTGGYTTNWATRPFGGTVDLGITGGFTTTARFYQLWIQPLGDNATGKTVLTRCRLATTDNTVTPQVLDLTVAAYSANINVGTLIPSADYRMQFYSKVFDDAAKQSNYAWWIDQAKVLNFRHRSVVPAPWILQSTTLGIAVDLEADSNLNVTIANDMFRNRQNLTGVLNTGVFPAAFQGDGQTTTFTLPYPVAPGTVPSITLNAVVQKVGKKGTTGAQFYYADSGTDAVIAQDSSLTKLVSTDRLAVNFTGIYTTTVTRNNLASQSALAIKEGGTGIVEAVEDVSSRNMMYAAAITYADQLLARYCIDGRTIIYDTYRNGLQPGMIQATFLPELGLFDSQMFITAIDVTMRTQPGNTVQYLYAVTASELANQGSWAKLLASSILLT